MKAHAILDLIEEIGILKNLPRTAWRMHGIKDCESIADHCYRVSLMSMITADVLAQRDVDIDVEKVMRIALLHEIAEARITDIPYPVFRYLDEDKKEAAEKQAVGDMLADFGPLADTYAALWAEFDEGATLEGRLVRAVDKLELLVQVYEYEKAGFRSFDHFWTNDWNQRWLEKHSLTRELFDALLEKRQKILSSRQP
jgi:putative hydrolase of HD superfamily